MDIKFNCSNPACQQRIAVDESMAGRSIQCPACDTQLQVPSSVNIKFNCSNPDCQQHIVVDVSEAGRFLRCPSCGKPQQIPGAPPKRTSGQVLQKEKEPYAYRALQKHLALAPPFKRLLYGWGLGTALFVLLITILQLRSWAALPKHFNAMLDEVASAGTFHGAPVVNHAGTELVCAREVEKGIGFFLVNLATRKRQLIGMADVSVSNPNNSFCLIGWSPDDSRFAYAIDTEQDQTIAVCEGASGVLQKTFSLRDDTKQAAFHLRQETMQGVWLNNDSLVLMDCFHSLYLVDLKNNRLEELRGYTTLNGSPPYALARVSDRSIVYADRGNAWTLDISTRRKEQLTHLPDNGAIQWLDYSPADKEFLFCLADPGGVRCLYRFNPIGKGSLTRLTTTDTLKGEWIENGQGVAYVGTTAYSANYLAIEPHNSALRTNLFLWHIRAYSVGPRQKKVYAYAAIGNEPLGLWEYDISSQHLHNVVPGEGMPFVYSKTIPPEGKGVAANGDLYYYYVLTPSKLDPHKKYPMVIDEASAPEYASGSQFLANVGIFYVSVYRNDMDAILAVHKDMLKNPNVDPHRIYIAGSSARTALDSELIDYNPALWRGAIFLSPVAFPAVGNNATKFPSIFISQGDEDSEELIENAERFTRRADAHFVTMKSVYSANAPHVFNSIKLMKERYKAMAKFILTDY